MFIEPVPEEAASGNIADIYRDDREHLGYVPGYTKVFSHHPEAYLAWRQLIKSIRGNMDVRRAELATLAAARALRSDYCSVAHTKILKEKFYDEETMRGIVSDPRNAGLDEVDVAVMEFAEKATISAVSVSRDDVERLKSLGLSDRDVLDVVLAVAARCFFATVLEALGAEPDEQLTEALGPELLEAALVGRTAEATS